MKNALWAAAITTVLLSACASVPKQPLSFHQLGHFSTTPLNKHTYRISFQARPNMNFSTAEEITLVKAAQTTLQQGFQFFHVLDDPSNRSQHPPRQALVYPAPMYYPYGYRRGYWHDPFYDFPQLVNVEPTQIAYSIECFSETNAPAQAFDARLILQSLGAKYGLSATGEALPTPTVRP